jgi:hypothetical protein
MHIITIIRASVERSGVMGLPIPLDIFLKKPDRKFFTKFKKFPAHFDVNRKKVSPVRLLFNETKKSMEQFSGRIFPGFLDRSFHKKLTPFFSDMLFKKCFCQDI